MSVTVEPSTSTSNELRPPLTHDDALLEADIAASSAADRTQSRRARWHCPVQVDVPVFIDALACDDPLTHYVPAGG